MPLIAFVIRLLTVDDDRPPSPGSISTFDEIDPADAELVEKLFVKIPFNGNGIRLLGDGVGARLLIIIGALLADVIELVVDVVDRPPTDADDKLVGNRRLIVDHEELIVFEF